MSQFVKKISGMYGMDDDDMSLPLDPAAVKLLVPYMNTSDTTKLTPVKVLDSPCCSLS